jgi:hypothetical protein
MNSSQSEASRPTLRVWRTVALHLVTVATVGACAGSQSLSADPPAIPARQEAIVFQFHTGGGLAGPCCEAWAVPDITAYGDGRVVVRGPNVGRVPGLRHATVREVDLAQLLADARDAGLLGPAPVDLGVVCCDMAYTNVVIADAVVAQEFVVMGLGAQGRDLTEQQVRTRQVISDLRARLFTLAEQDAGGSEYVPDELVAYARAPLAGAADAMPWPLDEPRLEAPIGNDLRCFHIAAEDDVGALLRTVQRSTGDNWTAEGREWTVFVRPLLPHEHGCPEG